MSQTAAFGGAEAETGAENEPMGMTVATAMALSGAAVSPAMGYHSSPWTAFLMTLFNVRLGAWLPNPAVATPQELKQSKPPNALRALTDEILGRSGSTGPAIYLSDGGHFDDLGLYEMVSRGCRLIVVVDAGEDADVRFTDLAGAVRKIRIDLDVEIDFAMPMPMPMVTGDKWTATNLPFALATITWPGSAKTGALLYVRPARVPDMPVDVSSYAAADPAFPHDSTINQFFSESQFESYRALGRHIGAQALGHATTLDFVAEVRRA